MISIRKLCIYFKALPSILHTLLPVHNILSKTIFSSSMVCGKRVPSPPLPLHRYCPMDKTELFIILHSIQIVTYTLFVKFRTLISPLCCVVPIISFRFDVADEMFSELNPRSLLGVSDSSDGFLSINVAMSLYVIITPHICQCSTIFNLMTQVRWQRPLQQHVSVVHLYLKC